ncbi:MAG: FHA domain-containing protein [Eggerthellaceae bacterium]|nr:FHA domain-containing protein [Eggerthellaceae bacterium]
MAEVCPICMTNIDAGFSSCPSCGFKLLGSTQEFKPIEIDPVGTGEKPSSGSTATLRVVRGPQIGMVYQLDGPSISLGRSPQCSIFLNDMTVSRTHAFIELVDDCHVIRDEHSYNGVWVNNRSIDTKTLESGDNIQIGVFLLRYSID